VKGDARKIVEATSNIRLKIEEENRKKAQAGRER
jgi:hypothetical protein